MSELKDLLNQFNIDIDAIKQMRKRIFIVGRFNNDATPDEPEIHLFTNRKNLTERYRQNFSYEVADAKTGMTNTAFRVNDLSYDTFVKALRPRVAETLRGHRIKLSEINIPTGNSDMESVDYVLDRYNYFFQRAITTCQHPAFKDERKALEDLLPGNEKERGATILKQIRQRLRTFCEFQVSNHELVDGFARLLGNCANQHGLPGFAHGAALPGGFPEKLIEFLYKEDDREFFKPDGLVFSGQVWQGFGSNDANVRMFCDVVNAFRDSLTAPERRNYYARTFVSGNLSQLAISAVDAPLRQKFQKARDALNGLRQILKSRVLLQMILEWTLNCYYEERVIGSASSANQADRDEAVAKVIAQGKAGVVAPPVPRPSADERERFSATLSSEFNFILDAVTTKSDVDAEKLQENLPDDIKEVVRRLRQDAEIRKTLEQIISLGGSDGGTAFKSACKVLITDVICPVLYSSPILTRSDLRAILRSDIQTAYMTAVCLGGEGEKFLQQLAKDHLAKFQTKIDTRSGQICGAEDVRASLLTGLFKTMASPKMAKDLREGMEVLASAQEVLEAANTEAVPSVAQVCAIRRSTEKDGSLERTQGNAVELIQAAVERKTASFLQAASAPKPVSAPATAPVGSPPGDSGAAPSANISAKPESAAPRNESPIDRKIQEILRSSQPPSADSPAEEVEEFKRKVVSQVMADQPFVGGLSRDFEAYGKTLHLIYKRYGENLDKKSFRNTVERMTLSNMMLAFEKEVGIGDQTSYLHKMLLDLIFELDAENPDPFNFIKRISITRYLDNALFEGGTGVTTLRNLLSIHTKSGLANIVSFISHLRGIKFMLDQVGKISDVEVIVVNATADQFKNWLVTDNLDENSSGRMVHSLIRPDGKSERLIKPGLVYLTDLAFPNSNGAASDKAAWLESLNQLEMFRGNLSYLVPPLCFSVGHTRTKWAEEAQTLNQAASQAVVPVIVLGPSPVLNADAGFPTVLPAGYLFCAHFLGATNLQVGNAQFSQRSEGRLQVLFTQIDSLSVALEKCVWGNGTASFAADYYLYIILNLWGTLKAQGVAPADVFKYFVRNESTLETLQIYKSSSHLSPAVTGGNALRFALEQEIGKEDLVSVAQGKTQAADLSLKQREFVSIKDVLWFNRLRTQCNL